MLYKEDGNDMAIELSKELIIIHQLKKASEGPGISQDTDIIISFSE